MFSNVLDRWKSDWIDPALLYFDGNGPKPSTDSALNLVSIEYPEQEVCNATHNFDPASMLGSGTFGSVYKGTMKDGTEVAIKVLQVPEEAGFEEEVKVLSKFRHPNLVILMGFSRHAGTGGRSLIYEYLAGGDVSKRLQKSRQKTEIFDWKQRLSAALDSASGLSHLHNANPRAFHRDIKGPNILLDKNGTAKMADFGLSCVSVSSHHKVQQASGTVGYACSEYIRTGVITEGSEVHSFGMVLLELLTAAPPAVQRPDKPTEFCYLVDHLQGSLSKAMQMIDETANFPQQLAQTLADLAFKCITHKQAERPTFVELVGELRRLMSIEYTSQTPNQPSAIGQQQQSGQINRQPAAPPVASPQPNGVRASGPPAPHQQGMAHHAVPAGLVVGATVEVRRRGGSQWVRARIARANPGNTFAVKYDDDVYEDQLPLHFIRVSDVSAPQQVQPVRQAPTPAPAPQRNIATPSQNVDSRAPVRGDQLNRTQPPPNGGYRIEVQNFACRLNCIFAEGVTDLNRLRDQHRQIEFPKGIAELVIGRTAQPSQLWDTLVPDGRLRGTVSREHFKIRLQKEHEPSTGQVVQTFYLSCLSLNGLLLNKDFVRQGDGDRVLQHGDILAFAANLDAADRSLPGPPGSIPRKPFLHFLFETTSTAPASAAPPQLRPPLPNPTPTQGARPENSQWIEEDAEFEAEPAMRLPDGCVAGRWRRPSSQSHSNEGHFCLEVHGGSVRMNLPSEARQLTFECPIHVATPPVLRLGSLYQRGFWQRVLKPEWKAGASLDRDLFEIRSGRRSNPATREPAEWRYRVRVLTSRGMSIRYSNPLERGAECELNPSDTLTIDLPPVDSLRGGSGPKTLQGNLHFTFIPYNTAFGAPLSGAVVEKPKLLPDFSEQVDDGIGGLVVERTSASSFSRTRTDSSSLIEKSAAALRPPMPVPETDSSMETSPHMRPDRGATNPKYGLAPMKTIDLGPIDGELDGCPDDLFSKTGFVTPSVEGHIPALAESRGNQLSAARSSFRSNPDQRQAEDSGSWVSRFQR